MAHKFRLETLRKQCQRAMSGVWPWRKLFLAADELLTERQAELAAERLVAAALQQSAASGQFLDVNRLLEMPLRTSPAGPRLKPLTSAAGNRKPNAGAQVAGRVGPRRSQALDLLDEVAAPNTGRVRSATRTSNSMKSPSSGTSVSRRGSHEKNHRHAAGRL